MLQAFRQAGRFDRAKISARAGLVAALPVAAMLALGTALGSAPAAVAMGVGAMLAGVAWRAGDGPVTPPVATMLGASAAVAVTALAGMLTGRVPWLHLLVLVVFCLLAGSAATLGRPGLVVGTQALIGFIVFGRFPESAAHALTLTGLVLAGGAAQSLLAAAVTVPFAWRRQRAALAGAYQALADFAGEMHASFPAASALDNADAVLSAPALFADPDRVQLIDLVGEGRRIRLELLGFSSLLAHVRRVEPRLAQASEQTLDQAVARVRELLLLTVAAIRGEASTLALLPEATGALSDWDRTRQPLNALMPAGDALTIAALDQRLAALVGQVTAAARLAAALHAPGRGRLPLPLGRPAPRGSTRLRRLAEGLRRMRTGTTLRTAAGRHALRLAVVVPLTELLIQRVALPRAYWAVVAVATVLRPGFGQTFTRGAERVLGTMVGVFIATLVAVGLNPSGWGVVAVVAVLAYGTYAVFPASFAAGIAMLTGVVVFLLHAVAPGTIQTALDRGLDTAIGGAIGLVAYALWPTWSALSVGSLLASLVDAQRAYLDAVIAGLRSGRRLPEQQLRTLARRARLAFADAEATIGLARSEPAGDLRRPDGGDTVAAQLAALRRIAWGVHGVRLDAEALQSAGPLSPLNMLQAGLDQALALLAVALRGPAAGALPPLRAQHRELARSHPHLLTPALWASLDELIDAIDTAAAAAGLNANTSSEAQPSPQHGV